MVLMCHRCGAELPSESVRGFCAVCGAPQIVLGELDLVEAGTEGGAAPPPRVSAIRWGSALGAGGGVAVLSAVLFAVGSAVPVLSVLSVAVILGSAGLVLAAYRRLAPGSAMTAGIGARIGLAAGVLMLGALAVSLAVVGVAARFKLHAMGPFDAQWAGQLAMLEARTREAGGAGSAEVLGEMARPEFRAWSTLGSVGLLGAILLGFTAMSGALVGSMGAGRRAE